ncbi:MAG: FGGY family carbohydrate kinase [Sandaracinaceae bacterium]
MTDLLLAIDAGTGSGRAGLFDRNGRCVGSASRPWAAHMPAALAPLGREYDADVIDSLLKEAITEALGGAGQDVVAITVTGQRIACAFVGDEDETLYLGPNSDVRAMLGADLDDLDPEALYTETGRFPPWIFAPARARWLESMAPDDAARLRWVLDMPGWFAHRLGAAPAIDPTLAADLMMIDVRSGAPRESRLPFPPLSTPGTPIGELAANPLGMRPGTPIVLGAADTPLALLASDVVESGTALVAGSSAPLLRVVDAPITDPLGRLWLDPHAVADRWLVEANLGEMGTCHAWTARVIAGLDLDDKGWAAYDRIARDALPGCRGSSAHLGPRAMDLRQLNTGRPAGLLMPFGETSTGAPPGRPEVLRSFLESCAYATKAGLAWLDAVAPSAGALHVSGGMSRSAFFCQLLADVLARPILGMHPDATLRGAAACAAVGAGWFGSLPEAARAMARPGHRFEPDETAEDAYEDAFERWTEREALLEDA